MQESSLSYLTELCVNGILMWYWWDIRYKTTQRLRVGKVSACCCFLFWKKIVEYRRGSTPVSAVLRKSVRFFIINNIFLIMIKNSPTWNLENGTVLSDGAGNMSGPSNGAAAIVKRQYPKAVYTHCMVHRLNLSVVSACKMQSIRNMFDTFGEITRSFEYSPKKEALLVQKVKDVCPESRRHKLLDVCKARWIQRMRTIKTNAEKSWNADSTKKAVSHYHAIANLEFVVTLTVQQLRCKAPAVTFWESLATSKM